MKKLSSLILLIMACANLSAQEFKLDWAHGLGASVDDQGFAITTDLYGYIYSTGTFYREIDFDQSSDTHYVDAGLIRDIFIQKLNSEGKLEWVKAIGGELALINSTEIEVDMNQNIYISGYFNDTVDFDPGPGTAIKGASGTWDAFLLKLDKNGELLWFKTFGGDTEFTDHIASIELDAQGNIYAFGEFFGSADLDPGSEEKEYTAKGAGDIFFQKFSSNGDLLWVKSVGGAGSNISGYLELDPENNLLLTGYYTDTIDLDPGPEEYMLTSNAGYDVFVLKLDNSGTFQWAKSYGGVSYDLTYWIKSDAESNVYLAGAYVNLVDFDPSDDEVFMLESKGGYDGFIQKLDKNGKFVWAKSFGGLAEDVVRNILISPNGMITCIGYFTDKGDLDPGTGKKEVVGNGGKDIFIANLDKKGELLWVDHIGGTADEISYGAFLDNSGHLYLTGGFRRFVDFDPDENNEVTLRTAGKEDIFVAKLSLPTSTTSNISASEFAVYPNPSNGILYVETEGSSSYSVNLKDTKGATVYSEKDLQGPVLELDFSRFEGMYFLEITSKNQRLVRRIMVGSE